MMEIDQLRYVQEHISCQNYAIDSQIINIAHIHKGECLNFENSDTHILCFLINGSMYLKHNTNHIQVNSGKMFFISKSSTFFSEAIEQSTIVLCFLNASMALCNEFSIKNLIHYSPKNQDNLHSNTTVILAINNILLTELKTTAIAMETGLLCFHYQKIKRDIFFLMLRGFYTKP